MNTVYAIKCLINNKYYIGATTRPFKKRQLEHLQVLKNNTHHSIKLQRAWNKYGEDAFSFILLEENILYDNLTKKEQYWIDYYNAYTHGYNGRANACPCPANELNGMFGKSPHNRGIPSDQRRQVVSYCITTGKVEIFDYVNQVREIYPDFSFGFMGCITLEKSIKNHFNTSKGRFWFYSEDFSLAELKKRFELKNKPHSLLGSKRPDEACKNISNGRKGMKFSTDHKKNMSLSRLGKHSKKIQRNDGKIFNSIKEAAQAINCSPSQISHHLAKKNKTCYGFTFSYII
jgi:predicted GIY-YIG superfamily endonuclease